MALPDWQLPPGTNRGLWDYAHDAGLARSYDGGLAGSPLLTVDVGFVERHCPGRGRLLDLGCGTGRLLVPFADRGWEVIGVDLSPAMLAVAQGKVGPRAELVCGNLTQLPFADGSFDAAACLFSTLGMVIGAEMRRRVLGHVARVLRPGGRFVLHVHNRWFNAWDRGGRAWLARDAVSAWWRRGEAGDRVMPVHQGIAGLTLHLFTRREAVGLVRGAGLRVLEVRPISLRADGRLRAPWWFGGLRAYGYLLAAERP
jgi:SAM-dependent methyltransferase